MGTSDTTSIHTDMQRASFGHNACLYLAGTIRADDIERRLGQYYGVGTGSGPLLLDFTDAEYIDIAALVNCIALMLHRYEAKQLTFFAHPAKKAVRDFLQVWRFPEAVSDAIGVPFSNFLLANDLHYLNEPQTTYTGRGDGIDALEYDPDWSPQSDSPRNFFEFLSFFKQDRQAISPEGQFLYAPRRVSRRWAEPSILEVLATHMSGDSPKEEIARILIFEAVSNAVRHPSARVIQVVSKFERKFHKKSPAHGSDTSHSEKGWATNKEALRICVWDDGESIDMTLRNALELGPIQAFPIPPFLCERIFVQLRDFEGTKKYEGVVDESDRLTSRSVHSARLLLMSLFPGVSRAISQRVPQVKPFEDPDETAPRKKLMEGHLAQITAPKPNLEAEGVGFEISYDGKPQLGKEIEKHSEKKNDINQISSYLASGPGMGLYALRRTVLDQFQGTLFIRSGRYRLIIEVAHDAFRKQYNVRYKCKITEYPKWIPSFRGNLLILQLPTLCARQ